MGREDGEDKLFHLSKSPFLLGLATVAAQGFWPAECSLLSTPTATVKPCGASPAWGQLPTHSGREPASRWHCPALAQLGVAVQGELMRWAEKGPKASLPFPRRFGLSHTATWAGLSPRSGSHFLARPSGKEAWIQHLWTCGQLWLLLWECGVCVAKHCSGPKAFGLSKRQLERAAGLGLKPGSP